eukprot:jgi/Botrbrau1/13336/Bobra.0334s0012.1
MEVSICSAGVLLVLQVLAVRSSIVQCKGYPASLHEMHVDIFIFSYMSSICVICVMAWIRQCASTKMLFLLRPRKAQKAVYHQRAYMLCGHGV